MKLLSTRAHPMTALAALTVLATAACDEPTAKVTGDLQSPSPVGTQVTRGGVGSRIVFTSDRDDPGSAEVYVMNADGTDVRILAESAPGFSGFPGWGQGHAPAP